ncbi:MAG: hypothetical protein LUG12_06030 [Erysipelotrichaceae bacterium]|nr:hypothetical protein [Erysipelotrichaceae bacterium]
MKMSDIPLVNGYEDYWEYILKMREKYTDRQFHDALENLQPPCSFNKYTMISYAEYIALEDGIGELLEIIEDEEDFKRKINSLIEKLLIFKKHSNLDETHQVKYLLHLLNEIISKDRQFQQDSIQYDICQLDSIVLYVEIISELYAIDFWKIYEGVPHKRIML